VVDEAVDFGRRCHRIAKDLGWGAERLVRFRSAELPAK